MKKIANQLLKIAQDILSNTENQKVARWLPSEENPFYYESKQEYELTEPDRKTSAFLKKLVNLDPKRKIVVAVYLKIGAWITIVDESHDGWHGVSHEIEEIDLNEGEVSVFDAKTEKEFESIELNKQQLQKLAKFLERTDIYEEMAEYLEDEFS